jgi:hypothetical protein
MRERQRDGSPVAAEALDLIRIELPGESVEITREERGFLLRELCFVADSKSIREALERSRPQRRLRD